MSGLLFFFCTFAHRKQDKTDIKMDLKRTYTLISIMLLVVGVHAQRHYTRTGSKTLDTVNVVKTYTDSLLSLRARIDSLGVSKSKLDESQYYRLFVTPTFYHSAITGRFDISDGQDAESNRTAMAVDSALMALYMRRPDLVSATETQLKKAGTIRNDVYSQVKPKVEMAEKVEKFINDESHDDLPQEVLIRKPHFWTFNGDNYLQFLQNYVSGNWYKGGESNYSMVGTVTLNANYNNKSKLKWENKLELKLGFQTSRGDTLHKFKTNNDLIRYTGKVGLQASKHWYYTLQLLAYTQFTQSLKSNDSFVYSDFMSPFNFNLGIGMDYSLESKNKKLSGSVNLAPLSFNFRYVDRQNLTSRYSISGDHHTLEDFGSQITCNLTWALCDQVKWKSRLYFYTTYKRTEIEWENTLTLSVSKYISANIFFYPRFDDSATRDDDLGYLQFKEYSSLGLSYSF